MTWQPNIEIVTDDVHKFFLKQAYLCAHRSSDDIITKIGAVIVKKEPKGYRMLTYGVNHIPHQAFEGDNEEMHINLLDKKWKYANVAHAERCAINRAKEENIDITDTIMYMPWVPCDQCAEEIIRSKNAGGIHTLIGHKSMILRTAERWQESTDKGVAELKKAGINLYMYEGDIGGVVSTMDSQIWLP